MKSFIKIVFLLSTILLTSFSSLAFNPKQIRIFIGEYLDKDFNWEHGYNLLHQETINIMGLIENTDATKEEKEELAQALLKAYIDKLESLVIWNPEINGIAYNDNGKFLYLLASFNLGYDMKSFMLLGDKPITNFINNYNNIKIDENTNTNQNNTMTTTYTRVAPLINIDDEAKIVTVTWENYEQLVKAAHNNNESAIKSLYDFLSKNWNKDLAKKILTRLLYHARFNSYSSAISLLEKIGDTLSKDAKDSLSDRINKQFKKTE